MAAAIPSFSRAQVLVHRAHLQGLSGNTRLEVLGLDGAEGAAVAALRGARDVRVQRPP